MRPGRPLPALVPAGIAFGLGALVSAAASSVPLLIAACFVVRLAIGLSSVTAPLGAGCWPICAARPRWPRPSARSAGANFAVSLVFLSMLRALGTTATFLVYAALCAATIVFTAAIVPETTPRTRSDQPLRQLYAEP